MREREKLRRLRQLAAEREAHEKTNPDADLQGGYRAGMQRAAVLAERHGYPEAARVILGAIAAEREAHEKTKTELKAENQNASHNSMLWMKRVRDLNLALDAANSSATEMMHGSVAMRHERDAARERLSIVEAELEAARGLLADILATRDDGVAAESDSREQDAAILAMEGRAIPAARAFLSAHPAAPPPPMRCDLEGDDTCACSTTDACACGPEWTCGTCGAPMVPAAAAHPAVAPTPPVRKMADTRCLDCDALCDENCNCVCHVVAAPTTEGEPKP